MKNLIQIFEAALLMFGFKGVSLHTLLGISLPGCGATFLAHIWSENDHEITLVHHPVGTG